MNNEIIKTLNSIKSYINQYENEGGDLSIPFDKWNLLLDYITNLQTIEQQYSAILSENAELENKITNLQEENEILRKNAEHNDKVVDKAKWNEMIYKSRNKKAIEYIKQSIDNPQPFYEYLFGDENGKVENLDKLLNILNGDKDE